MSEPTSAERLPGGLPLAPECPFCSGSATELMNPFGSQLSVSTYWCTACRCPFEVMKWRAGAGGRFVSEDGEAGASTE